MPIWWFLFCPVWGEVTSQVCNEERRKERRFVKRGKYKGHLRGGQGSYWEVWPENQAGLGTLLSSEIKNFKGTQSSQLWFPPTRLGSSDAGRTRRTFGLIRGLVLSPTACENQPRDFFLKRIDTQAPPPETDSVDLQWGPGMGNFEISLVLLKFLRLRVSKRESNSQKKADDSRTIILIEQGNWAGGKNEGKAGGN